MTHKPVQVSIPAECVHVRAIWPDRVGSQRPVVGAGCVVELTPGHLRKAAFIVARAEIANAGLVRLFPSGWRGSGLAMERGWREARLFGEASGKQASKAPFSAPHARRFFSVSARISLVFQGPGEWIPLRSPGTRVSSRPAAHLVKGSRGVWALSPPRHASRFA